MEYCVLEALLKRVYAISERCVNDMRENTKLLMILNGGRHVRNLRPASIYGVLRTIYARFKMRHCLVDKHPGVGKLNPIPRVMC